MSEPIRWWCIGCGDEADPPAPPNCKCSRCNGAESAAGLTKRETIAAMAMQGLLAGSDWEGEPAKFAPDAVDCADALLLALGAKP